MADKNDEILEKIQALQGRIDGLNAKLNELSSAVADGFSAQSSKLSKIERLTPQGFSDTFAEFEKIMRDVSYKMFKG